MLPFSRPSCNSKTRPPSCALGTSFYTVSEGSDLMTYVSYNYTSYSAPSRLSNVQGRIWNLILGGEGGHLVGVVSFNECGDAETKDF